MPLFTELPREAHSRKPSFRHQYSRKSTIGSLPRPTYSEISVWSEHGLTRVAHPCLALLDSRYGAERAWCPCGRMGRNTSTKPNFSYPQRSRLKPLPRGRLVSFH